VATPVRLSISFLLPLGQGSQDGTYRIRTATLEIYSAEGINFQDVFFVVNHVDTIYAE